MVNLKETSVKSSLRATRYLLPLLTLNFATLTLAGITEQVTNLDVLAFAIWMLGAICLQLLVLEVAARMTNSRMLALVLAAGFGSFNLFCTHLILVEDFLNLSLGIQFILAAIAFGLFQLAFWIVSEKLVYLSVSAALLTLVIISNVATFTLKREHLDFGVDKPTQNHPNQARPIETSTPATASPKIEKVKFTETPNVYLIGWESAAPGAVLRRNLGLQEAPLEVAMSDAGLRMFRNVFSEANATLTSWEVLLSMDRDYATRPNNPTTDLFSGKALSPLIQIFQYNGYEVTTAYANSYLGGKFKGPYVDHYIFPNYLSPCQTPFISKERRIWLFFGVCKLLGSKWYAGKREPFANFLVDRVILKGVKDRPQLIMAHIDDTLHTPSRWTGSSKEIEDFREEYRDASVRAAHSFIKIMNAIREHDPHAVVVNFGDHGVWLSRHKDFSDDPIFFIQDRFGVMAGVWPPEVCTKVFDAQEIERYRTTNQIVRLVVKCLSGGKDPFVGVYRHGIAIGGPDVALEHYTYE